MIWIILIAVVIIALIFWSTYSSKEKKDSSLNLIQQQLTSLTDSLNRSIVDLSSRTGQEINTLHQRIDERLKENIQLLQGTHQSVGERIDRNTQLFGQVQERLVTLEEASKRIETVGKDISELQDILQAPKLRGNLGELLLEDLLSQILPRKFFQMQYAFQNGQTVDAIVKLASGNIVPIDAKFPLENFKRIFSPDSSEAQKKEYKKAFASDVKKHITHIADRYIKPAEGTLDFALLYVPAENVYYETILRDDTLGNNMEINTFALSKRVVPVSPNSLYAYLQAIVLGLRGLQIQEQAKEIYTTLSRFKTELIKLEEEFGLLGRHLSNAQTAYDKSRKRLEQTQTRMALLDETPNTKAIEEKKTI